MVLFTRRSLEKLCVCSLIRYLCKTSFVFRRLLTIKKTARGTLSVHHLVRKMPIIVFKYSIEYPLYISICIEQSKDGEFITLRPLFNNSYNCVSLYIVTYSWGLCSWCHWRNCLDPDYYSISRLGMYSHWCLVLASNAFLVDERITLHAKLNIYLECSNSENNSSSF